ncbi:hypothetical protein Cgig2_018573 [Carnegiea gigantea]|uniref:DUF8040 domain-containing protein n=1 Tax=Carnegiea gigantea TaxID=171969 RepID=A0A9Q1QKH7_9CARY|nr:hypothetical protein Cgig2_018573 [Carnegiea gigantea]
MEAKPARCLEAFMVQSELCDVDGYRKLSVMAASGKNSANWTNRDDEKLLDILIEQRVQGSAKFEWSLVRVILKIEGINKKGAQIKNHFNYLGKKLKAWEFLISKPGVGMNYKTGVVVVSDSARQDFLQRFGGKYNSFCKKVPTNLEKMKSAFMGSTSLVIVTKQMRMVPMQRSNALVQSKVDLPLEVYTALGSKKVKAGILVMEKGKNFLIAHQEMRRQQSSLIKQVQARLKEHPQISAMGSNFIWSVIDYIKKHKEEKFFMDLGDEFVVTSHQEGFGSNSVSELEMDKANCRMEEEDCTMDEEEDHVIDTIVVYTLEQRLPKTIGRESVANYIHRLLYRNRPDLYREVLCLDRDVFIHLVSMFMERGLLKEGHFVKAAEIVAITLFILARGAGYREAKDRFQHSPSAIGKYHKQVLDGLVQVSADIARPYQSQDELPSEIVEKKGFYWPFFKIWPLKLPEDFPSISIEMKSKAGVASNIDKADFPSYDDPIHVDFDISPPLSALDSLQVFATLFLPVLTCTGTPISGCQFPIVGTRGETNILNNICYTSEYSHSVKQPTSNAKTYKNRETRDGMKMILAEQYILSEFGS